MAKPKKKLTCAQREEKARRRRLFMTVFINGEQVRVRRSQTIDGVSVEEFIRQNADPVWLLQNEMYELIDEVGEKPWSECTDGISGANESGLENCDMHIRATHVDAHREDDYYQIFFAEKDEEEDESEDLYSPYLLVQRQFEDPNDEKCYVEMHDRNYVGHFRLSLVEFTPERFVIKLHRRRHALIEVSIVTTSFNFEEATRMMKIITGESDPFEE